MVALYESLLDKALATHIGMRDALLRMNEKNIATADARYADLMASYRLLRLQGATEAPKPPRPPEPKDETQTAIARAIREQSHGDPGLMKLMWQQVDRDRVNSLNDVQILQRIQDRTPTSDGVLP
jgi:hypothetical protein